MDHFGIGKAMECMALTYSQTARGTGRTTSLIESLKSGDRVICATQREANLMDLLCRERNLVVTFVVINPSDSHIQERALRYYGTSKGRTLFDHNWIEQFYLASIRRCGEVISHVQRETSGYGAAHSETKREAEESEMAKFTPVFKHNPKG